MLRNWNFTIVITSISTEVKEKYCCLKSKWRRNIFLNKAAIYLRGNVGLMTPAIIYIYPGTNVRRFLNKLYFILSTTIEKKHPVYLRTAKKRCPRWRSCSAPRSVPESSTPKQSLIKWGFTEYVISFSTCRFKAVCIRNKTSFLFQQTLEIANVPELTTKGDNFFSSWGWMNTVRGYLTQNQSFSVKQDDFLYLYNMILTFYCSFSFTTVFHLFQSRYFR